jgi:hypothetical protein
MVLLSQEVSLEGFLLYCASSKNMKLQIIVLVAIVMVTTALLLPIVKADDATKEIESSYHHIMIESPKNGSIHTDKTLIPIDVTVDYIYTENKWVVWRELGTLYYSIDGKPAEKLLQVSYGYSTPIPYKNSTVIDISKLSNGTHTIEITAEFYANVGHVYVTSYNRTSSPVFFNVDNMINATSPSPTSIPTIITGSLTEPFSTLLLVVAIILLAVVIALVLHVRKH